MVRLTDYLRPFIAVCGARNAEPETAMRGWMLVAADVPWQCQVTDAVCLRTATPTGYDKNMLQILTSDTLVFFKEPQERHRQVVHVTLNLPCIPCKVYDQ